MTGNQAAGGILDETLQSELLSMIKIYKKLKVNYTCKNMVVRSFKCVVKMPTEGFYLYK